MKAETNDLHVIFLLKKNVCPDIIKTLLGYLLMAVPKTLREWKVAITSVRQEYKFIESRQDYRTRIGITYGGRSALIDIGKAKDNFDKDGKLKYFNCNVYRHMAKNR